MDKHRIGSILFVVFLVLATPTSLFFAIRKAQDEGKEKWVSIHLVADATGCGKIDLTVESYKMKDHDTYGNTIALTKYDCVGSVSFQSYWTTPAVNPFLSQKDGHYILAGKAVDQLRGMALSFTLDVTLTGGYDCRQSLIIDLYFRDGTCAGVSEPVPPGWRLSYQERSVGGTLGQEAVMGTFTVFTNR